MKILTGWFSDVLDSALVMDSFEIDGDEEDYVSFFETEEEDGPEIALLEDGYSVQAVETHEKPAAILRSPDGEIVGFYWSFQLWIAEEHRGRNFGSEMIVKYADHFGEGAWFNDEECADGIGFSPAGFRSHVRARMIAERSAVATPAEQNEGPSRQFLI